MVWVSDLDQFPPTDLYAHRSVLSPQEFERAVNYRKAIDGRRFAIGRRIVRTVLGSFLGIRPNDVVLVHGPDGKPHVRDDQSLLNISWSRSSSVMVVAMSIGARIGIDVEVIRPFVDGDSVPVQQLSPQEQHDLSAMGSAERVAAFYHCWVRKEAYLKGLGVGLGAGLDGFSVSVAPDGPVTLTGSLPTPQVLARWNLAALDLGGGLAGALAVESPRHWAPGPITPERLSAADVFHS